MSFFSVFFPGYAATLVYMLQSTEYQPLPYLRWYWRTNDFSSVAKRRQLDRTKAARLLLLVLRVGMAAQIIAAIALMLYGLTQGLSWALYLGFGIFVLYPILWAHLIVLPLVLGRIFVARPKEKRLIAESENIFAKHPGVKIAVAGSYGKTTMKELLGTVLSEGKNVAITPANKNVASSHAIFAAGLKGDEEVLVIEYGEGRPGDVARFSQTTKPSIGVITGVAPAHLDHYPTLEAAGEDIFSLAAFLNDKDVYVNKESEAAGMFIKDSHITYDEKGVDDWKVSGVKNGFVGIHFTLAKGSKKLNLKSGLMGRHQVGPLAAVAAIADNLGLTKQQIEEGIAKTMPFEHRMMPRQLGGAWLIDDTYNGNIDGIKAGLELLSDLPGKRKIYVTPGLVDQGIENERVHKQMGRLIAQAKPDKVVLMKNSVTSFIKSGLEEAGFRGELQIESDPLGFYNGIEHFIAAGDVVLMQNDWTDNYY
jgi:UDP-N-acetylmuramoyl-tripeptide--D-alanyl-D-alanine ligase